MIETLAISNYRSLREITIALRRLNVITGANGSGKSSIYRSLRLLAETSQGSVTSAVAREGGLTSTLWAGPESISRSVRRGEHAVEGTRRSETVHLRLGFSGTEFGYAIDIGLPSSHPPSAFSRDPEIKRECIWSGPIFRQATLLADRKGSLVQVRDDAGDWVAASIQLLPFDSMLAQMSDPRSTPEIFRMREIIRSWRFYDHFRTDATSPVRQPQVGTHTPVLANDGSDLAAALQTILEIGDHEALAASVEDAFPGSEISIKADNGRFEVEMHQHGLLRPLCAAELSDGTLRYLLWIAALLSPRPPALLVLNEPEASLHPDLLPALARLILRAAKQTQILVVSHASRLVAALELDPNCNSVVLEKEFGETGIIGQGKLDRPSWHWPQR
jgi:predicted ATPase